jgi:carbon-monoxide dehydrogenase medium subunit
MGGDARLARPGRTHTGVDQYGGCARSGGSASGELGRTLSLDFIDRNKVCTLDLLDTKAANSGGAYLKNERKVGDYAVSAVAVQLTMNGSTVSAARIALTNVNSVPMRALNAEQALIGQMLSAEVLEAAGRAAAAECDPSADLRGSVEYKRDLTRVLTKRAIRKAAERAVGGN